MTTFYAYTNDKTGEYYFYSPDTGESTYSYPEKGEVLDPETGEAFNKKLIRKNPSGSSRKHASLSPKEVAAVKKENMDLSKISLPSYQMDEKPAVVENVVCQDDVKLSIIDFYRESVKKSKQNLSFVGFSYQIGDRLLKPILNKIEIPYAMPKEASVVESLAKISFFDINTLDIPEPCVEIAIREDDVITEAEKVETIQAEAVSEVNKAEVVSEPSVEAVVPKESVSEGEAAVGVPQQAVEQESGQSDTNSESTPEKKKHSSKHKEEKHKEEKKHKAERHKDDQQREEENPAEGGKNEEEKKRRKKSRTPEEKEEKRLRKERREQKRREKAEKKAKQEAKLEGKRHKKTKRVTSIIEPCPPVLATMRLQRQPSSLSQQPPNDTPFEVSELLKDIHKFQAPQYAKQFFRQHRKGIFFNRKVIPFEEMISFTSEAIDSPLLQTLPSRQKKNAVSTFNAILAYTGVKPDKSPVSKLQLIINLVDQYPELRDEVYFQIIRQTRNNPNREWLKKTWELFLIMATLFPSSRNSQIWIQAHIASSIDNEDKEISHLCQFTYIRFEARCSIGRQADFTKYAGVFHQIPDHMYDKPSSFGVSIYEIMWWQRKSMKNMPVPFPLHFFSQTIIKLGGLKHKGLFRLPGNLKKVEAVAERFENSIGECSVNDVCSLMKKWIRELSTPVIPDSMLDDFVSACESKHEIDFFNSLPRAHRLTLMYLVGFLKQCAEGKEHTLMGPANLAMVFAPNIIMVNETDAKRAGKYTTLCVEYLQALMASLDTTEVYPLPPGCLE